jgi:zinc transporter, ZIP family
MIEAFLWGGIAASSLLIGSLLALRSTIPRRTVGLIMGFGAGVLLSAVAYDLVLDATLTETRSLAVFLGLLIGACTFFLGNRYLERQSTRNDEADGQTKSAGGWLSSLGPFSTAFRSRSSWV